MGDSEYQRYLASREWGLKKNAVRARAGGSCERCHYPEIAATHHLTYERVGREELEDLQALCGPCHAFVGGFSDFDPLSVSIPDRNYAETRAFITSMLTALGPSRSSEALAEHLFLMAEDRIRYRNEIRALRGLPELEVAS